jgi:virginiamycin B lyase
MTKRTICLALVAGLAAVHSSAGDIPGFTWKGKPNFPGFARGMTLGPDSNLWLTDADANAIGRVALDGTVVDDYKLGTYTGFPIPTANGFPVPITAGPDGNLWFVELNNGGKIGRCTTTGVITEFALPGPSGSQWAIASGLDGNLWLSNSPSDAVHVARILKVTPDGIATPFPLATGISVGNLVAGPDRNIWFVERSATVSGIGRITP